MMPDLQNVKARYLSPNMAHNQKKFSLNKSTSLTTLPELKNSTFKLRKLNVPDHRELHLDDKT